MTRRIPVPEDWTAEQALTVTSFLESVTDAIWRAHGEAMAWTLDPPERQPEPVRQHPEAPASPAASDPEDDLPF